jgi:hypothetical protein
MFLSIYHDIFRPHLFLRLLQLRNYLRATLRGLLVHMLLLLRTNSISSFSSDMQIFLLHSSPLLVSSGGIDSFLFSAKGSKSPTSAMQPFSFRMEWHMEIIIWFDYTSAFFLPTLATLEYHIIKIISLIILLHSSSRCFRFSVHKSHRWPSYSDLQRISSTVEEKAKWVFEKLKGIDCPCSTISVPWALCGSQNNS